MPEPKDVRFTPPVLQNFDGRQLITMETHPMKPTLFEFVWKSHDGLQRLCRKMVTSDLLFLVAIFTLSVEDLAVWTSSGLDSFPRSIAENFHRCLEKQSAWFCSPADEEETKHVNSVIDVGEWTLLTWWWRVSLELPFAIVWFVDSKSFLSLLVYFIAFVRSSFIDVKL